MNETFFFYDLETSGLNPREDRIMQFAGQRTDSDLNPLGDPVNILVKITDDALPSPGAINVTKITPQDTLRDGITEAEFCRFVTEEVFTPNTIILGYNTVRFDDEFMRAILWRNFYDPYEWQWRDGRSRWDLLDVVRLTRALRPEGIEWPFREDGAPTNRLELITKLNGVKHEHAHDALSDVYATIAVAKLIKSHQPDLFSYLLKLRNKNAIKNLVNLASPKPFVYASGRFSNEFNKTTVAYPLAPAKNGNLLVLDLRFDPTTIDPENAFPKVKEFCFNKCPAVAPLGVLEKNDGWSKIGLTSEAIKHNLSILKSHPEFAEKMRTLHENRSDFPPASEPEAALYDGFLNDPDRIKVSAVRNADISRLADFHPDFTDERLPELLLHYKGHNYPSTLSEKEAAAYESYRQNRLAKKAPEFIKELDLVKDPFLKEELLLYLQSLQ